MSNFGPVTLECFNKWKEKFSWLDASPNKPETAYCLDCKENLKVKLSLIAKHQDSVKHKNGGTRGRPKKKKKDPTASKRIGTVTMKCFNKWMQKYPWLIVHPSLDETELGFCIICQEGVSPKHSTIAHHETTKKHHKRSQLANPNSEGQGGILADSNITSSGAREVSSMKRKREHEDTDDFLSQAADVFGMDAPDDSDIIGELSPRKPAKKMKRPDAIKMFEKFKIEFPWLASDPEDEDAAYCTSCNQVVPIKRFNLVKHESSAKHVKNYKAKLSPARKTRKGVPATKVRKRQDEDIISQSIRELIAINQIESEVQTPTSSTIRVTTEPSGENKQPYKVDYISTDPEQPVSFSITPLEDAVLEGNLADSGAEHALPDDETQETVEIATLPEDHEIHETTTIQEVDVQSVPVEIITTTADVVQSIDSQPVITLAGTNTELTAVPGPNEQLVCESVTGQLRTVSVPDQLRTVSVPDQLSTIPVPNELTELPDGEEVDEDAETPRLDISKQVVQDLPYKVLLTQESESPAQNNFQRLDPNQVFVRIRANAQYPANIQAEMKKRLMSSEGWDASWVCSDGKFQVHKFVLMLFSPVLKSSMHQDETVTCIYTPDLNCVVVKSILCLFYTGSVILLHSEIANDIQSALHSLGCTTRLILENYIKPKLKIDPSTLPFRVGKKKRVIQPSKKAKALLKSGGLLESRFHRIKDEDQEDSLSFVDDFLSEDFFDVKPEEVKTVTQIPCAKEEERNVDVNFIKIEVNDAEDPLAVKGKETKKQKTAPQETFTIEDDEVPYVMPDNEMPEETVDHDDDIVAKREEIIREKLGEDDDGDEDYHPSKDEDYHSSGDEQIIIPSTTEAMSIKLSKERIKKFAKMFDNKENNPCFVGDHYQSSKYEHYTDTKHRYYLKGKRDGIRKGPLSRNLGRDLFDSDDVVGISVCSLCYDIFQTRVALKYHMQEAHKVVKGQSRTRGPYHVTATKLKCPKCNQVKEVSHIVWFVKHMKFCGVDQNKANAILGPKDIDFLPEDEGVLMEKELLKDGLVFKKDKGRNVQELCLSIFGQISDSIWGCRTCYELFLSKADLDNHRNNQHNGRLIHGPCYDEESKQYTCKFCGISNRYARVVYFIRHMKQCLVDPTKVLVQEDEDEYDEDTAYNEIVDPWGVINKPLRVRNQKSAWICEALFGKMVPIIYPCHVCYSVFAEEKEIRDHFSNMHPGVQNTVENGPNYNKFKDCFTCPVCKKEVSRNTGKTSVYFTHHLMKCLGKTFRVTRTCNTCNKSFSNYKSYHTHNQNPCNTLNKFLCHICSVELETKGSLRNHVRHVHTDIAFECAHCDAKYKRKADLVVHAEIHNNVQYPCESCGKVFQRRRNLKRHLKTHLPDSEKQLKCPFCPSRFNRKRTLDNHLTTHGSVKRFQCDICEVMLKTRENLRSHRKRVHKIAGPLPPPVPELVKTEPIVGRIEEATVILPDVAANTDVVASTINMSEAESMLASLTSSNNPGVVRNRPRAVGGGKGGKKKTTTSMKTDFSFSFF